MTKKNINLCFIYSATMRVYRDFFSYRGGVYRRSAASRAEQGGFHSVRLLGWGEERTGYEVTKFWVCFFFDTIHNKLLIICLKYTKKNLLSFF